MWATACDGCKRRGNLTFGRILFCGGVGFRVLDMGSGSFNGAMCGSTPYTIVGSSSISSASKQSRYYMYNFQYLQRKPSIGITITRGKK